MSSLTSYVAVDLESHVEGTAVLRRVPVALTRGWGGMDVLQRMPHFNCSIKASATTRFCMDNVLMDNMSEKCCREDRKNSYEESGSSDLLMQLMLAQQADGSWRLTRELAKIVGVTLKELKEEAALLTALDSMTAAAVVATRRALLTLETRLADREVEWKGAAAKARTWLAAIHTMN